MTTSGQFVRPRMGTGNVLVPAGSRRAALAGVALLTRSKLPALAAQWALYGAVAVAGPRAVPGPRERWEPPGGAERWAELAARIGPFDGLAVYERPQASRSASGLAAVLLRGGRPLGFLKVRADAAELDREAVALAAFPEGRAAGFRVPRVLDRDVTAGWSWLLIEAMPPRPARPARRAAIGPLTAEIGRRLAGALPRPDGTPPHWRPMHGDLTAWNLRRCGRGAPWLIDWEDAAWAPPDADRVYYEATHAVVFGRPSGRAGAAGPAEAVEFWRERVARRSGADHDAPFNERLDAVLRSMTSPEPAPA